MASAFERSIQPDVDNLQGNLFRQHSLAQRKHVGVIVLAREACAFVIPAKSAANSFDAIRSHRFAIAGTTEHNPAFKFAGGHGEGNRPNEERIVDGLFRISAKVSDFMPQPGKVLLNSLLVPKSRMV